MKTTTIRCNGREVVVETDDDGIQTTTFSHNCHDVKDVNTYCFEMPPRFKHSMTVASMLAVINGLFPGTEYEIERE